MFADRVSFASYRVELAWVVGYVWHILIVLGPVLVPRKVVVVWLLTADSSQNSLNQSIRCYSVKGLPDFHARHAATRAVAYTCSMIFVCNDSSCRPVPLFAWSNSFSRVIFCCRVPPRPGVPPPPGVSSVSSEYACRYPVADCQSRILSLPLSIDANHRSVDPIASSEVYYWPQWSAGRPGASWL